jgi:cytochrome c-type biogenesis protein CcmH/NrfG
LLQKEKDPKGALAVLELATKENPDDMRLWVALGRAHLDAGDSEKAAAAFEKARSIAPPDNDVLETLAKLYAKTPGEKLTSVLSELAARTPDAVPVRLLLAKLSKEAGKQAEVERWAREALFVDVNNAEARELLLAALRAQKKDADADKLEKRFKP